MLRVLGFINWVLTSSDRDAVAAFGLVKNFVLYSSIVIIALWPWRTHALLPCGHLCMCRQCCVRLGEEAMSRCPVCRSMGACSASFVCDETMKRERCRE